MKRIFLCVALLSLFGGLESRADVREGKPRALAVAKRAELKNGREAELALERQKRETAARDAVRMRNLPYAAALAVAQKKVAFEDLDFTEDDRLIDNEKIPPASSGGTKALPVNSHRLLRVGGMTLSAVLLVIGFAMRRRKPETERIMPARKRGDVRAMKAQNLEE